MNTLMRLARNRSHVRFSTRELVLPVTHEGWDLGNGQPRTSKNVRLAGQTAMRATVVHWRNDRLRERGISWRNNFAPGCLCSRPP